MTEPHPLFPADDECDAAPEVKSIHVTRGGVWCQRMFDAAELPDLETVHELFGGGLYELIARGERGHITARRRYRLDGAPKPLDGTRPAAAPSPDMPPPPAPVATPNPDQGMGGVFALLMQMLQNQAQQQQAFLIAMLDRSERSTSTLLQSMQSATQESAKLQASVMTAALSRSGGGDPSEVYLKGIQDAGELLRGVREGAAETGESDLKTVADAFGMAMAAARSSPPPAQGAAAPQTLQTDGESVE